MTIICLQRKPDLSISSLIVLEPFYGVLSKKFLGGEQVVLDIFHLEFVKADGKIVKISDRY